jgi:hypothetical protein
MRDKMSNRRDDRQDWSSGESIDSEDSDDVESGRDDSIHTSDKEFIESDTSTDSEGEYQYDSDDECSQGSGTNDENEDTEGDDEEEDDLSTSELEALSISSSPRTIPLLSRAKDGELPLGGSSKETGSVYHSKRDIEETTTSV